MQRGIQKIGLKQLKPKAHNVILNLKTVYLLSFFGGGKFKHYIVLSFSNWQLLEGNKESFFFYIMEIDHVCYIIKYLTRKKKKSWRSFEGNEFPFKDVPQIALVEKRKRKRISMIRLADSGWRSIFGVNGDSPKVLRLGKYESTKAEA